MTTREATSDAPAVGTTTRQGLAVLGAAGVLGVLGDGLLRAGPPGISAALWLAAFFAGVLALHRALAAAGLRGYVVPASVATAFALGLAWRDSDALKLLDLAVVGTIAALLFLRVAGARLRSVSLCKLAAAAVLTGVHAALGSAVLALSDVRWRELRGERRAARAIAVVRGLAIAAPIVAVFGALLVGADAVFARLVTKVLGIDIEVVVGHIFFAGFFAWVAGGVLRCVLLKPPVVPLAADLPQRPLLGMVETGVVLGVLDVLFLSFVVVQVRYLFGGAGYVESLPGLTYAEYARHGFFELVGVAALAIPLLLASHWLLRRDGGRDERIYRGLAGVMAVLLAVMMISGLQRMLVYTAEYGLSELRVYTLAFMAWLGLVLAWFAATVLVGRRDRFAFGALAAGVAVVAIVNVCNPDDLIARVNIARAAASGRFDAAYAGSLSADAAPALVAGLATLAPAQREAAVGALARTLRRLRAAGWRTWSVSRARALRALEAGPAELRRRAEADDGAPRAGCAGP